MKKKIFLIVGAVIIVLGVLSGVFLAWYFKPMPLSHLLTEREPDVLLIGHTFYYTYDEEWQYGDEYIHMESDTLRPGDALYSQVLSLLEKYEYRRCIGIQEPRVSLSSEVDYSFYLSSNGDGGFISLTGMDLFLANHSVYALCGGQESASALAAELKELFGYQ